MATEGWARKKPLTPPLTNIETKPSANKEAELILKFEPYKLPIQINTMIVEGMVMAKVGNENTIEEKGFIPLMNM